MSQSTHYNNFKAMVNPHRFFGSLFKKLFLVAVLSMLVSCSGGGNDSGNSNSNGNGNNHLVTLSLSSITPADKATNISVKPSISLSFSKAVSGVTNANILLSKSNTGSNPVALSVTGSANSYTLTPTSNLEYNTEYFILIKAANIRDAANNALGSSNQVTSFTTYKQNVIFSAWLGSSDSKIDISTTLSSNSELYTYTGANYAACNISNISACSNGQSLLLNGQTITNTTHTLTQNAFYKLKEGSLVSSNSVDNTARFSVRENFQAVVFKNKFWVIGGRNGSASSASSYKNDVWSSDDGINWTQQSINGTHFSARDYHQVVVFQNKLWVIGGTTINGYKNDVWSSTDGVNWTEELTHSASPGANQFSRRYDHKVVVFNNKLWLFGGRDGSGVVKNDVWSSSNGQSWSQVSINGTYFSAREGQQVVVANIDGSNKLWVIGGYRSSAYLNDVWSSDDGVNWTEELANNYRGNQFSIRSGHQVVVANIDGSNKLWLIAGYSVNSHQNDVWSSADGQNWSQTTINGTHFVGLYKHQVVVRNNKFWLIGGNASSGNKNDVWRSSDGATWRKGYSGKIIRP